jgi:hypothetical protein
MTNINNTNIPNNPADQAVLDALDNYKPLDPPNSWGSMEQPLQIGNQAIAYSPSDSHEWAHDLDVTKWIHNFRRNTAYTSILNRPWIAIECWKLSVRSPRMKLDYYLRPDDETILDVYNSLVDALEVDGANAECVPKIVCVFFVNPELY